MRNSPYILAILFLAITIGRVALLVQNAMRQGWQMGWIFAAGLAAGVYVSAYFVRHKETKWIGVVMLAFFGVGDFVFNEVELMLSLSGADLVASNSNFIGLDTDALKVILQITALFFGGFPTVAAAGLGFMQSGAEKVNFLNKPKKFGNFAIAFRGMFGNWFTGREGMRVVGQSSPALESGEEDSEQNGNMPSKKRWPELTQDDRIFLLSATMTEALLRVGGSKRRINLWKQDVRSSK